MVLVYLGISLPNQISNPLNNKLGTYTDQDLMSCKLSHDEYPLLLDKLKSFDFVQEAVLITTCNRFELIMFLEDASTENIYSIRQATKEIIKSEIELSLLIGEDAQLQFLRTYCGLNSGLIAEDEICMQMEIAFKQCFHMGYLGKEGMQLFTEAQALRSVIDEHIYQERVSYCQVAIETALNKFQTKEFKNIIIAGSGSTSHQSCLSLVRLGLRPETFTLAHRISSSSTQIAAIKASTELTGMNFQRVKHGYHSQRMKDLVSDCDLLVLGIDSRLPSLHFSKHNSKPVIDFSSKPSLSFDDDASRENYFCSSRLDHFVREYSEQRLRKHGFMVRIELAEAYIAKEIEREQEETASLSLT